MNEIVEMAEAVSPVAISDPMKIVLCVAISLGVTLLFLFLAGRFFKGLSKKSNGIHIKFFNSLIKIIIVIIEIYYLLTLFEATREISKTLLGGGAIFLTVISFGAQHALGNVISGFFISASKPYNLNDKIKVVSGGSILAEGIVSDITTRHTVIHTFDGQACIIPNSVMDSSVIINTTYTENVGNFFTVDISYESDVDVAMGIVKKLVVEHPLTLNDESTTVMISQMTDNGLTLKTTVWTKILADNFQACSDIRGQILSEFKKANIVIPYNTITVKSE